MLKRKSKPAEVWAVFDMSTDPPTDRLSDRDLNEVEAKAIANISNILHRKEGSLKALFKPALRGQPPTPSPPPLVETHPGMHLEPSKEPPGEPGYVEWVWVKTRN